MSDSSSRTGTIEFCGNRVPLDATSLTCNDSSMTDLSPLRVLTCLEELDLTCCEGMRDITPLAELKKLKQLNLCLTGVENITPLQELAALEELDLSFNNVTDFAPLNGLKNLRNLTAMETPGFAPWVIHAKAEDERCREKIVQCISEAFDGAPLPTDTTLYEAENADDYGSDRHKGKKDHMGRWQDLPDEHVLDCQWAFPYLSKQGVRYYLPAFLVFMLRYMDDNKLSDNWIFHAMDCALGMNLESADARQREHSQEQFCLLTPGQNSAVNEFVQYYCEDQLTRTHWSQFSCRQTFARERRLSVADIDGGPLTWGPLDGCQ